MAGSRYGSLGRRISILYRFRNKYFERSLTPYGIGPSQLRVLLALQRQLKNNSEVTQTDIARLLRLDKSALTKSIRKLEEAGYVLRERSECDCREYRIYLTDKARQQAPEMRKIRRNWSRALGRGFTDSEQKQVHGLLKRMAENAEEFILEFEERVKGQ